MTSDEYTPTTEEVRNVLKASVAMVAEIAPDYGYGTEVPPAETVLGGFDRWLAQHDADTVMAFANHFLKHEDWKKARKFANDIMEGKA